MVASSVSARKLRANRRNARKSTGPRSAEGKARASLNSITHGVFSERIVFEGEDQDQFDLIRRHFIERLRPQDLLELSFVERVAEGTWRLMRLNRWDAKEINGHDQPPRPSRKAHEREGDAAHSLLQRISPQLFVQLARLSHEPAPDRYGPSRQKVEQSISRALRELRILQSPHRHDELPVSPFLEEESIEEDDSIECDHDEAQNEPTETGAGASPEASGSCEAEGSPDRAGDGPALPSEGEPGCPQPGGDIPDAHDW